MDSFNEQKKQDALLKAKQIADETTNRVLSLNDFQDLSLEKFIEKRIQLAYLYLNITRIYNEK